MSRSSTLDEPADINADIGTPTWARGVARALEFQAKKLNSDVKSVHMWIALAAEHEAWRVLGYASLDVFLVAEAAITQSVIDAIRNAKSGTIGDAIKSAKAKPLAERVVGVEGGQAGPGRGNKTVDNVNRLIGGNAIDYTLRRLARDCPEMLDRIEAGELSVNAAAIAAGIRKKPTPEEVCVKAFRKAENRMEALRLITSELQPHEAAVVRDWIAERLQ